MGDADHILRLGLAPDDRAAWTSAVEAYQRLCWRIALRMLGDADGAADAVQDCLLALRQAAPRFRPGPDPEAAAVAWVARIAVNTCQQRRRRRPLALLPDHLPAPEAPADDEVLPALRNALDELPTGQREAVVLRYLGGLDYEQVGQSLGIAAGAARVRVSRALDRLRNLLERRGVVLPATALGLLLDGLAEAAVPAPHPAATAAWTAAPLPPIATSASGAILAMSISACAIALSATLVYRAIGETAPSPAAPAATAAAPAGFQGLDWLAARQAADGSWSGEGEDGTLRTSSRVLLVFLGAGYDARMPSRHRATVARGLAWVETHPAQGASVAVRALRLMALAEQRAMTDTDGGAVADACNDLLGLRLGAAWPRRRGDLAVDTHSTMLAVLALKSVLAFKHHQQDARDLLAARDWAAKVAATRGQGAFPAQAAADGSPLPGDGAEAEALIIAIFAGADLTTEPWEGLRKTWTQRAVRHRDAAAWVENLADYSSKDETWLARAAAATPPDLVAEAISASQTGNVDRVAEAELGLSVIYRWKQSGSAKSSPPDAKPADARKPVPIPVPTTDPLVFPARGG